VESLLFYSPDGSIGLTVWLQCAPKSPLPIGVRDQNVIGAHKCTSQNLLNSLSRADKCDRQKEMCKNRWNRLHCVGTVQSLKDEKNTLSLKCLPSTTVVSSFKKTLNSMSVKSCSFCFFLSKVRLTFAVSVLCFRFLDTFPIFFTTRFSICLQPTYDGGNFQESRLHSLGAAVVNNLKECQSVIFFIRYAVMELLWNFLVQA